MSRYPTKWYYKWYLYAYIIEHWGIIGKNMHFCTLGKRQLKY